MESNLTSQGVAGMSNQSLALFQSHNLETVAEESEDAQKAITDLNVELLVEDSTKSQLSKYLTRLLQCFVKRYAPDREINSFDFLFVITYCVSLETGFIPAGHQIEGNQQSRYPSFDRRVLLLFSEIIPEFYDRNSRSYRLNLLLPGLDQICYLVGNKSGDFICLTFMVPPFTNISGKSIFLPVSRYVPLINLQKLNLSCQHLKDLSHKLKNDIFIPVRDAVCLDANVALYPSLSGLPDEVVAMLLVKYLDKKATFRLAATCTRLRTLAKVYRGQWFA